MKTIFHDQSNIHFIEITNILRYYKTINTTLNIILTGVKSCKGWKLVSPAYLRPGKHSSSWGSLSITNRLQCNRAITLVDSS